MEPVRKAISKTKKQKARRKSQNKQKRVLSTPKTSTPSSATSGPDIPLVELESVSTSVDERASAQSLLSVESTGLVAIADETGAQSSSAAPVLLDSTTTTPVAKPKSSIATPSAMHNGEYWQRTAPCIFQGDKKYRKIVIVDQPIYVFGRFRVQCLFGIASINDVVMKDGNFDGDRWEDACFPYSMEMPGIIASKPLPKSPNMQRLKWRLAQCCPDAQVIVAQYKPGKAVVVIEGRLDDEDPDYVFRTFCQTVGYFSLVPVIAAYGKVMGSYAFSKRSMNPLYSSAVESYINAWEKGTNSGGKSYVTVVIGNKGVGKSSLVRHLANIKRNTVPDRVYILDLDVGQPLFGPPGSIGLHKIHYSLLGAPFAFQQLEFQNSIYIGTVELSRIAHWDYAARAEHLMKIFHGGVHYMNAVLDAVNPDFMFNLRSQKFANYEPRQSDRARGSLKIYDPFVHRNLGDQFPDNRLPPLSAATMRSLQCTTYMSALGPIFATMRPYQVGFSKITLHLSMGSTRVSDNMYLGAFNQTFVALCVAEKTNVRRLMGNENMPYRTIGEGEQPVEWLKCVGYGLIRAIDIEKRRLYLLTPVSMSELKKVDVLSRCEDINLSQHYMTCQAHKEAPYWIWVKTNTTRSRSERDKDFMSHLYNKVEFVTMKKRYYKHTARQELDN
ncbi:hypothetical protein QR680_012285 [Steinernema hermaphroditum]|uniref:Uncharacterized protein n=1 Tax=Steinernema hermaphroditum TaxID=289476 RepID=A0AA39I1J8_9BILA|nr:hypothetical protein QR680_012285 [Steinernema hermaphroditum]